MILTRTARRLAALAAAFGIALQALWPAIVQAAPAERTLVAALCSVDHGVRQVEIKLGKPPLDERASTHGEHCKLCVFGVDKPAVASATAADAVPGDAVAEKVSGAGLPVLRSSFAVSARPRAPPQAS